MDEQLQQEIKSIVEFVETLPEAYRAKCFDALFARVSRDDLRVPAVGDAQQNDAGEASAASSRQNGSSIVVPAKVRAFMARNKLGESELERMVIREGKELHFVHEPRGVPVAHAQVQWSLLLALKSAVDGGDFAVDPEAVRSICVEKGVYDAKNFASVFKRFESFYQKTPVPHGDAVKLSSDGEQKLAELVRSLPGGAVGL